MEITSIKGEEQDEIEEILLPIHGNEAINKGGLDEYISKLTEFSKDGLERKKVDVESQIASASLRAAFVNSAFIGVVILVGVVELSSLEKIKEFLLILPIFSGSLSYIVLFKDGWKRNNRLCALKMALIGK